MMIFRLLSLTSDDFILSSLNITSMKEGDVINLENERRALTLFSSHIHHILSSYPTSLSFDFYLYDTKLR